MPVFKLVATLTVAVEADSLEEADALLTGMELEDLARSMMEGNHIGVLQNETVSEVPPEEVEALLISMHNDGTFFSHDDDRAEEEDEDDGMTPAEREDARLEAQGFAIGAAAARRDQSLRNQ